MNQSYFVSRSKTFFVLWSKLWLSLLFSDERLSISSILQKKKKNYANLIYHYSKQ